jgi:hypothetical protein
VLEHPVRADFSVSNLRGWPDATEQSKQVLSGYMFDYHADSHDCGNEYKPPNRSVHVLGLLNETPQKKIPANRVKKKAKPVD